MKIAISTHPESKRQLIIRSLRLYGHVFTHVFFLSLLLSIVVFLPRILALVIGQEILSIPAFSPERLWFLLINLSALIFFSALIWRIRCVITDEHESIGDDMKIALKKIPYILVAVILQNLLFIVISVFFTAIIYYFIVTPQQPLEFFTNSTNQTLVTFIIFFQFLLVLYLFFAFYFYLPTIVIENKGILSSLAKSASLVWGNWWRTLIVQMTPWVIYLVCLIIIRVITRIDIHIYYIAEEHSSWLASCLQILMFAIFIPWFGTNLLVQLRDLELRKI